MNDATLQQINESIRERHRLRDDLLELGAIASCGMGSDELREEARKEVESKAILLVKEINKTKRLKKKGAMEGEIHERGDC